jgi:Holliday junction resolvase-like predicted endonuclease
MDWREAEDYVKKQFEKQGCVVLNQNDEGFPDLMAFKDGKIAFFVQVVARQKPYVGFAESQCAENLKEKLGVEVKYINVKEDGKMETCE